jgi:[acyl-carrier-protein] S-malonyltransferase
MAGLSLGEYTALVAAGAMSFADALTVVKVRAEAMQAASALQCSGMMTIVNMDEPALMKMCATASREAGETVQICNMLFPKGLVVGGAFDNCSVMYKPQPT